MYNASKVIIRCINSIKNQTYNDFEVIVVDDGSKDNSYSLVNNYVCDDKRFILITQNNQGVSAARNKAIEICHGDWITFIDADDYIDSTYLESIFAADASIDLVLSGWKQIDITNGHKKTFEYLNKIYNPSEFDSLFSDSILINRHGAPWAKLFKTSIIKKHNLKFNIHLKLSEDRLFLYEYLLQCNSIVSISYFGYNYQISKNSIMKNKSDSNEELLRIKLLYTASKRIISSFKCSNHSIANFENILLIYIIRYLRIFKNNKLLKREINTIKHNYPLNISIKRLIKIENFKHIKGFAFQLFYLTKKNTLFYLLNRYV